jgi:hypothetical protein
MPEEQAQGQQTIEKAEKAETIEKVDNMQEPQEPEKKRVVRPMKAAPEQVFSPSANRSYWPFALALIISISLMGVVIYPIVFFIGVALTVIIIIAWSVERR